MIGTLNNSIPVTRQDQVITFVNLNLEPSGSHEHGLRLGANAREFAVRHYDLNSVCLPRQLKWVDDLAQE